MKKYKVGVFEEVGGYITIEAKNAQEAEDKALELVENKGVNNIEDFDDTHRDYSIVDSAEEVK